jgi:hypothetical protein
VSGSAHRPGARLLLGRLLRDLGRAREHRHDDLELAGRQRGEQQLTRAEPPAGRTVGRPPRPGARRRPLAQRPHRGGRERGQLDLAALPPPPSARAPPARRTGAAAALLRVERLHTASGTSCPRPDQARVVMDRLRSAL